MFSTFSEPGAPPTHLLPHPWGQNHAWHQKNLYLFARKTPGALQPTRPARLLALPGRWSILIAFHPLVAPRRGGEGCSFPHGSPFTGYFLGDTRTEARRAAQWRRWGEEAAGTGGRCPAILQPLWEAEGWSEARSRPRNGPFAGCRASPGVGWPWVGLFFPSRPRRRSWGSEAVVVPPAPSTWRPGLRPWVAVLAPLVLPVMSVPLTTSGPPRPGHLPGAHVPLKGGAATDRPDPVTPLPSGAPAAARPFCGAQSRAVRCPARRVFRYNLVKNRLIFLFRGIQRIVYGNRF